MKKSIALFFLLAVTALVSGQSPVANKQKAPVQKDTIKKNKIIVEVQEKKIDSLISVLHQ